MPRHVFLGEVMERTSNRRKVLDEPPIKVGKADECSYFFERCGSQPIFDCRDLPRVHANFSRSNDHSQILHFTFLEVALLRLQVEVVLLKSCEHVAYYFAMVL